MHRLGVCETTDFIIFLNLHAMSDEYERGLALLESLISGKKRQDGSKWEHAFDMMHDYLKVCRDYHFINVVLIDMKHGISRLQRLELSERLSELHAVHVTGTKGKGSTCAMVESILRTCGYRTGLFTSPHLIDVRERIRIDGYVLVQLMVCTTHKAGL